jgi:type I restriction enzyme, S subunit
MGEMIECPLRDVCASVDYGFTASANNQPVGPHFLRITDIVGSALNWEEVPYVTVNEKERSKYRLHHDDIVIARTGATTGESAYISHPPEAVFASYLVRLKIKPEVNSRYVAYWLKSAAFKNFMHGVLGEKSAQPNASASTMTLAPFRYPKLRTTQDAVVDVLSALDDKIELNRRMNATLEAQARALFRDWFVDFGPVKAKMAGTDAGGAPYLAPDLWSLFPNRLSDDGVPEGWFYSEIGSEVDAVGGSTPSTTNPEFWNGEIAWTTPKDLSGLNSPILLSTSRSITPLGLAKISSGLLPKGTVLLSSRAPVGYLAITEIPLAVNQGYIAMRCEGRISNYFAFLWAQQSMDLILQNANGSTFQEISKKSFRPLPVIVADQQIHQQFDSLVEPLFQKIVANERESRALAQTRDLLLPKLMSGEIRVRDAEREVEVAL